MAAVLAGAVSAVAVLESRSRSPAVHRESPTAAANVAGSFFRRRRSVSGLGRRWFSVTIHDHGRFIERDFWLVLIAPFEADLLADEPAEL
jgi:hypothetical protein